MKVLHIIGADLSKKTIDFSTVAGEHLKVTNDLDGYQQFLLWLKKQKVSPANMMVVMEHTGFCSYKFERFMHQRKLAFSKVSALAIKRSMGLVRGKNDKIDARRIARYGFEKQDQLVATRLTDQSLQRLQMLHSSRERLVRSRAGLLTVLKEYKDNCSLPGNDLLVQSHVRLVKDFDREIERIEREIQVVLKSQKELYRTDQLLQSITGVGKVVSVATIVKTRNFTRFAHARKFACHCGTAPFEHTSGSSLRGKTKVSHLADKEMKTLLDLAAKTAIQHDKELHDFYVRRTQAGKLPSSTRNIIRNKIIFRMFAVVKRQTPYIKTYQKSA